MYMDEIRRINSCKHDFYAVLCVDKNATSDEINASYRRLAKLIHPDKNNHDEATATFKILGNAYTTLIHPFKRRQYNITQLYKNRRINTDEVDHPKQKHKNRTKRHQFKKKHLSKEKLNLDGDEEWDRWSQTFEDDVWYWDEPWDESLEADVYWEWFVGLPWDQSFEEYMYWGGNWDWEQEWGEEEMVETKSGSYKSKILLVMSGFLIGVAISRLRKPSEVFVAFEPLEIFEATAEEVSAEVGSNNTQLWALGAVSSVGLLTMFSQRFRDVLQSQLGKTMQFVRRFVRI